MLTLNAKLSNFSFHFLLYNLGEKGHETPYLCILSAG